jgi:hypothetical protein
MGSLIDRLLDTGIIEKLTSKLIGAKVRLGSAKFTPLSGRVSFKDIVVANPRGYHAPYILRFRRAEVVLDPLSLLSKKIVLREAHIHDAEAVYETSRGESNFSAILKSIDRVLGAKPARGRNALDMVRYEIDEFVIQGGRIRLCARLLPGKEVTLRVPPIALKGLGKEGPGVTGQEVAALIIRHIVGEWLKAILPGFGKS